MENHCQVRSIHEIEIKEEKQTKKKTDMHNA